MIVKTVESTAVVVSFMFVTLSNDCFWVLPTQPSNVHIQTSHAACGLKDQEIFLGFFKIPVLRISNVTSSSCATATATGTATCTAAVDFVDTPTDYCDPSEH